MASATFIPSRANYLEQSSSVLATAADRVSDSSPLPLETASSTTDASPLVTGGDDPLRGYLLSHLDHAHQADLLASFVLESGVAELEAHLRDLLDRGSRVRVLVGDYLGITEPNALLRLLDLQQGIRGISMCASSNQALAKIIQPLEGRAGYRGTGDRDPLPFLPPPDDGPRETLTPHTARTCSSRTAITPHHPPSSQLIATAMPSSSAHGKTQQPLR